VGKPAVLGKKPDEIARDRGISAGLEDHSAIQIPVEDERLAVARSWPIDGGGVPVVVVGPLALERTRNRERPVAVITTVWARNALLLPMLVQLTESGGVQPLRQIAV
jgi:hypothetical protein